MQQELFNIGDYSTLQKENKTQISVVRILFTPGLANWEKRFLKVVVGRKPTKSEAIVLEAIQAKINPDRKVRDVT